MNLSVGIVGLPNVGKSTLFNALLKKQQALAANYPFATIEPNVGVVPVPDARLQKLAEVTKTELKMANLPPLKPATVEFVDIAGLVKGASEGAGLGNKFLSHIREVSVVAHVVRAFENPDIVKEGSVDPKSDYTTIRTELQLADLSTIEKQKEPRGSTLKEEWYRWNAVLKMKKVLEEGRDAKLAELTDEERIQADQLQLLSYKPEIIVLNVAESDYTEVKILEFTKKYSGLLGIETEKIMVISAQIESELSELSDVEQVQYLKDLGLQESGLERLIKKAYETLGLISFLTAGEIEVRAWTIKKGTNAQNAAGVIHTDFIKQFIKAEIVSYSDFLEFVGWKGAREHGKARMEGKEYVMQEGDIVEFKIGK